MSNIVTSLTTYCQGLQKIIGLLNECGMTSLALQATSLAGINM
jgi:hypothetical protein